METIEEGDIVFDKDGNLTTVEHVSEVHNNPCFKITFDNNDTIICDQEHKWPTSFRRAKGISNLVGCSNSGGEGASYSISINLFLKVLLSSPSKVIKFTLILL